LLQWVLNLLRIWLFFFFAISASNAYALLMQWWRDKQSFYFLKLKIEKARAVRLPSLEVCFHSFSEGIFSEGIIKYSTANPLANKVNFSIPSKIPYPRVL